MANQGYSSNQQLNMKTEDQMMSGQMMPGQMMMPVDPNFFGGMKCFYVTDPLVELANSKNAKIKQRFELFEVLTGCETANQYYVFTYDDQGNQKYLFKAKEKSNCFCRVCVLGRLRQFKLHIRKVIPNPNGKEKKEEFAIFDRPFKCSCCCCCRPEFNGKLVNETQSGNVGRIYEPCVLCNPKIQVFNRTNNLAWTITCNCCQCGYFLRDWICGRCSEVDFQVYQGNNLSGPPAGTLKKKFKCCQSIVGDADFFNLNFPEQAKPEERLLLVAGVIMLDYMYYEDKGGNKIV